MAGRRQMAVPSGCRLHCWLLLAEVQQRLVKQLRALQLWLLHLSLPLLAVPAPLLRSLMLAQERHYQLWSWHAGCCMHLPFAAHGLPAVTAGRRHRLMEALLLVLSTSALLLVCGPVAVEGCQQALLRCPPSCQQAAGRGQQVLPGALLLDPE